MLMSRFPARARRGVELAARRPSISDASWSLVDRDVSAVADGNSTFRVRWGMGPTDGAGTWFGWNLDDIEIWGILPGPCNSVLPGDVDLNGVVDGRDVAAFARTLPYPAEASVTQWCAPATLQTDIVDKNDVTSFVGPSTSGITPHLQESQISPFSSLFALPFGTMAGNVEQRALPCFAGMNGAISIFMANPTKKKISEGCQVANQTAQEVITTIRDGCDIGSLGGRR